MREDFEGCGPNCHCVRRVDQFREAAIQGLVSDSIESFMPCDILKEQWEKVKGEIMELREKAMEGGALATAMTEIREETGDNAAVKGFVDAQTEQLSTLVALADKMGVEVDGLKEVVEKQKQKTAPPKEQVVQIQVPARPANQETLDKKAGPG